MEQQHFHPPAFALRFLQWFCPPALHESIEGDLMQAFEDDLSIHNPSLSQEDKLRRARRRYIINVLRFFHPEIILRNRFSIQLINTIMIGNYIKVATRNIRKRKLYSFINAFGLSIAIAFCMLIYLYIQDEKSFDQFHVNKNSIFRIEENSYNYWNPDLKIEDRYHRTAYVQASLGPVLKDELSEVVKYARFNGDWDAIIRYDDQVFTEKVSYTDKDFFTMFSFPLLAGNAEKLFENKSDAVITSEIAKKYFGDADPLGKTLVIDNNGEKSFTVAGIIAAPPANSSFDFTILLAQENKPGYERQLNRWGNFNTPTFVQLSEGADFAQFDKNLERIIEKYMRETLDNWREEGKVPDGIKLLEYKYTSLPNIHLENKVEWHKVSDPQYSLILGGIAVLILFIACINYISLALTTSAARRTEVGIRKIVGAVRKQLVYQFSFESVLLALISMVAGLGMMFLFLPAFNEFTGKEIQFSLANFIKLAGIAIGLTLMVGLLAGSYPAFFLSSFLPASVLKGRFTTKLQAGFTRPLVVLQFALSAFLIISSVIMYRQMMYVTEKNLGFNADQILVVPTQTGWNEQADRVVAQFRTSLERVPEVNSVAGTSISFNRGWSRYGFKIDGVNRAAYVYAVDPFYIPTLSMELVAGRNFDVNIASDTNAVIVNEALVKDMEWEDPLNQHYNWREDSASVGAKVIGVVKDYHYRSLEAPIEPVFLCMDYKSAGHLTSMLIKVNAGDVSTGLEKITAAWKALYPDRPFDYSFLDDDVAKQYASHQRWMNIMAVSTGFAVLISCLGLFGLAGINAVNRTKEIGIRKVLGAELSGIFVMLNKQYIWLSLIAFVIAVPFSWYVMDKWLASFQFRITMGWELFAVSIVAGLFVALATVSYHAIKASSVNPAETLKYE